MVRATNNNRSVKKENIEREREREYNKIYFTLKFFAIEVLRR